MAHEATKRLAFGVAQLAGAVIAWEQVAPIFRAAARAPGAPAISRGPAKSKTVLDARELTYRYAQQSEPVLRQCSLRVIYGRPSASGRRVRRRKVNLCGPAGGAARAGFRAAAAWEAWIALPWAKPAGAGALRPLGVS